MKYFTFSVLLFVFLSSTYLSAQTISPEQHVEDFLGTTDYESSLINNPGLIKYLKVKSLHGYRIETIPNEKIISLDFLPPIYYMGKEISASQFEADVQSSDFNFLKYNFPTIEKGAFRLNNENNTVIIILSNEQINRKMRNN